MTSLACRRHELRVRGAPGPDGLRPSLEESSLERVDETTARLQLAGSPAPRPAAQVQESDVMLTVEQTDSARITRLLARPPQPAA